MSEFSFRKKKWVTREDNKVFETPVFDLHRKTSYPAGGRQTGEFYVLNAPSWVNVIPVTTDRKVVLVEQYRHGIEEITLEIPGGMVDAGESPLDSVKRELAEETGYTSGSWSSLGKISSNPAIQSNFTYLFLASDCRKTERQQMHGFEDITAHTVDMERFLSLVRDGTIHHSIVVAAVAKYMLMQER